jgi:hypothetical protein
MQDSTNQLMKAPRIRLHFNVSEPVELVEMTLAFQGLGYEYQSYIKTQSSANGGKRNANDVKLYITKIESNCIWAELAPALPMLGVLAPVFADINTVSDFVRNTGEAIGWLRGLSKKDSLCQEDIIHTKRKINNLKDIVRLVGQNKNSNLGLHALKYEESSGEDHSVLEISFTDTECREAEQGAVRALQVLDIKEKADREKVLMYFYQTNTDDPKSGGRTGDKAFIHSISKEPLSVYIIPELDQQKIRYVLDDKTHNPLHTGFVVDVNIENDRKGQPKIYRVLRVHDVIYDEDDSDV